MTKLAHLRRLGLLVVLPIGLVLVSAVQTMAQTKDYQPGEKIEYKISGNPDVWEQGVFVKASDAGSYAMIRLKPTAAFPNGYERSSEWAQIRPIGPRPAIATRQPTAAPAPIAAREPMVTNEAKPNRVDGNVPAANDAGTGLMSQEQILSFLQTRLGPNQFQNPRRDEIKKELADMIKRRGLDFRYSVSLTDFRSKLSKVGTSSEIAFALQDNYGAPTKQSQLMGAWTLGKIGGVVDYAQNNRVYRQGETAVANIGTLTLNANGTYAWKSDTAQSTNGRWRSATYAEMKSEGGDGIVLLGAKGGYDWIVTKDRRTTVKGEWLSVYELGTRQIKEFGSR